MDPAPKKFLFIFLPVAVVIYILLEFVPEDIYQTVNRWSALAPVLLLETAGIHAKLNGMLISYSGFTVQVVGECSAVFVSVLPLSFFLAFPASIGHRLAGIFIGLPLLFAFNILRIAFIFVVGWSLPEIFPWVHLYLGQVVMILAVIWICLVWLKVGKAQLSGESPGKFILTALGVSILPFVMWVWLCGPYTQLVLNICKFLLETAGFGVQLPTELEIYPHTFISFNLIIILSCVLAGRMVKKKWPVKTMMTGLAVITGMHVLFQMLPILFFQHQIKQTGWFINGLIVINQFILPFVFWFIAMFGAEKWLNRSTVSEKSGHA